MNLKQICTFCYFITISFLSNSQISQPARFEVILGADDNNFTVITQDDQLLLFRPNNSYTEDKREWEFFGLDSTLNILWVSKINIDQSFVLLKTTTYKSGIYFLFSNPRDRLNLILIAMNAKGEMASGIISNTIPFTLTHFKASRKGVLIGGLYNSRPLVIYYMLESNKSIILPGFYHEKSELIELKINADQSIEIVLSASSYRIRNKLILFVKSFDSDGNLIKDVMLEDKKDKEDLLFGRSYHRSNGVQVVAGTYGARRSNYSRGLFLSNIDIAGNYDVKFYNYGEMENFFKFMSVRRESRIKRRVERRKLKNKKLRFNYRFLVHEIFDKDGEYIVVGEAIYEKYKNSSVGSFSGMVTSSNSSSDRIFDGYRYTHAAVASFDSNGKLLWDNSIVINDVKTFNLDRYVQTIIRDDKMVLLYVYDNQIRSKIIRNNELIEDKNYTDISMKYESDKPVGDNVNVLEKWYADSFYIHGVQNIKNLTQENIPLNRRVFYINKIIYD